ncbi:catenin (Cadherin-associated protein), alpha 3 [Elysia marginata]|uniref:Catenin (Cadherin-associated protein), alpha 3 n=1 Tax=Elysia marginata TaxID=1093978 RepID=A0AAV4JM84_9GAST|nr:catenin (Cadherin-associated protein), alpha 3 [Elysia marginata]
MTVVVGILAHAPYISVSVYPAKHVKRAHLCLTGAKVSEYLLQEAISEKCGILINGVNTNNIRYADDTVILAESERQLQAMLDRIFDKCKEYGMEINAKKTKAIHMGTHKDAYINSGKRSASAGLEIFIPWTHDHGGCCHSKRSTNTD